MPEKGTPPAIAERLLRRVLPPGVVGRTILGDLREEFAQRAVRSAASARRWYWTEALGFTARRISGRWWDRARARLAPPTSRKGDGMWLRIVADLRYALRTLRRSPGFAGAAGLTLALGIGATTAIFSVVNGILLKPLPFANPDQLVGLWHTAPGLGYEQFGNSTGLFFMYQEQTQAFEGMGLVNAVQFNISGDGAPERVRGAATTRDLFAVLGVTPVRGRTFTAEEDGPNGPAVTLISEGIWQRRYAGDPGILGRTIQVGGVSREVVGVLPEVRLSREPIEVWTPMAVDPAQARPGLFGAAVIARLRPEVSALQAKQQLDQVLTRLEERFGAHPQFLAFAESGRLATIVNPYKEDVVGDLAEPLWILLGTVGFVLLIACANVANLFLVRAEARRREMAVRNALGAARSLLIRQYLTESVVLAGLGGLAGLGLAWIGVPLLLRLAPPDLPRINDVGMDFRVMGFALLVSATSALLFGLFPAIRSTSASLLPALGLAGRIGSPGRDRHLVRSGLVVAQTALALVLLVGSGLLVRSFWELRRVSPGFDPANVVTFSVTLPVNRYDTPTDVAGFHDRLRERLHALPGVVSAGSVVNVPFGQTSAGSAFDIEDRPTTSGELPPMMWYTLASPDYFETMQVPLVSGRTFERRDHERAAGSVVVSQALADRLWPGQDAIGKRMRFAGDTTGWDQVIGVVGSVRDRGLREDPSELIYYPLLSRQGLQGYSVPAMTYTVRAQNPTALLASIRAVVWELDSELPITAVATMKAMMAASIIELSFTTMALGVAATMAVVLAAIGLYGVLAYLVAQRRQEIGVRIALGAQVRALRRMVVRQGAQLALVGIGIGLAGAFLLTRFLGGLLFGIAPLNPLAFVGTSVLLLGVVWMASYLPARRASAVDPVAALRGE